MQLPILRLGEKGNLQGLYKAKDKGQGCGIKALRATCAGLSHSTKIAHGAAGQNPKVSSFTPENSLDKVEGQHPLSPEQLPALLTMGTINSTKLSQFRVEKKLLWGSLLSLLEENTALPLKGNSGI